jgi:hypothetical protein
LSFQNAAQVGEWLTRGSVWVAVCFYVASEWVAAAARRSRRIPAGQGLNTLGFAAFALHVVCAFHFYHGWSHAAAYADTARQTAALTGWNWGGGLYLNYLFLVAWMAEVLWQWANPTGFVSRPGWITKSTRGLFLFMIFNGAVWFRGFLRAYS